MDTSNNPEISASGQLKNALLYISNASHDQFRKMQNSINSFARNNPDLLDSTEVYVVTSADKPELELVDSNVRVRVIREMSCDYSRFPMPRRARWPWNTFSRWEVFGNPVFADQDNVFVLDNDTVFTGSVRELFRRRDVPTVAACREPMSCDHVSKQLGRQMLSSTYCFGTMLVTPKLIGRATLKAVFDSLVETAMARAWMFVDQDAANFVFGQAPFSELFYELPSRFGRSVFTTDSNPEEAKRPAVVEHNCGWKKNYSLDFLNKIQVPASAARTKVLPIAFSTCDRTRVAAYCLKQLVQHARFEGDIFLYICTDRSSSGHVRALEDVLHRMRFTSYRVVASAGEHCGYGYSVNAALDDAFRKSDVALTVGDDSLLEGDVDLTPLVALLERKAVPAEGGYLGISLGLPTACAPEVLAETDCVRVRRSTAAVSRYGTQCMLRHASAFRRYRFFEGCSAGITESAWRYLQVPVMSAEAKLRDGVAGPVFRRIGAVGASDAPDLAPDYAFLTREGVAPTTVQEKREILARRVKLGLPIRVLFFGAELADCGGPKIKTAQFRRYLEERDSRFVVREAHSVADLMRLYDESDLIVPVQLYANVTCFNNRAMWDWMAGARQLVYIQYSLGWHKDVSDTNWLRQASFVSCRDSKDVCQFSSDALTGNPWSEVLNTPRERFADPWGCGPDKKRVLICPHHTVRKASGCGNLSGFVKYADMLLDIVRRYQDRVEFVMRPHPNLLASLPKLGSAAVDELMKCVRISTDADYVSWFKHSDALIHDCGSFRCEYLYVDKPVCYMANTANMADGIWTDMGRAAMKCHELCWYDNGDTLDGFMQRLLSGEDVKRDERMAYRARYCDPASYPNGKTPCENIVDAILGTGAYSSPVAAPVEVAGPPLHSFRALASFRQGLVDLVRHVHSAMGDDHKLTVVEIGSYRGESAQLMLDTGLVGAVYCVDPWKNGYSYLLGGRRVEYNNLSEAEAAFDRMFSADLRVVKHKGTVDSFVRQAQGLHGKVDLVYIDGLHTYDGVKHDIDTACRDIAPSFVAGHDYSPYICGGGVMRAVDERFGKPDRTFVDTSWAVDMRSRGGGK